MKSEDIQQYTCEFPRCLFLGEEVRARARFWRDQGLLDRANGMQMKSCDALEEIAAAG